jgi:hypothetical protein
MRAKFTILLLLTVHIWALPVPMPPTPMPGAFTENTDALEEGGLPTHNNPSHQPEHHYPPTPRSPSGTTHNDPSHQPEHHYPPTPRISSETIRVGTPQSSAGSRTIVESPVGASSLRLAADRAEIDRLRNDARRRNNCVTKTFIGCFAMLSSFSLGYLSGLQVNSHQYQQSH